MIVDLSVVQLYQIIWVYNPSNLLWLLNKETFLGAFAFFQN